MSDTEPLQSHLPSPVVAIAGWILPGAGYWLIGQRTRGLIVGVCILVLYILGLFVAGVRVIQVPGYDDQTGAQISMINGKVVPASNPNGGWALTNGGFISEIANKPGFAGQILAGPICLISAVASVELAQKSPRDYPRPHTPLEGVATLYTAIAGMLNLMVIIDAAYRAGRPADEQSDASPGAEAA